MQHAIKPLQGEIDRDMALLAITTLAGMRRERLMDARSFDGGKFAAGASAVENT
ncbi:MAG: hypothetical protein HYY79_03120 [Betaproteobacteria bacterium]|nr:hypothetical protein [Betaproteobacteria bacterium]